MYIATFYSFKGGVGRTMALVNVAVDLARRGRRVIVVDFDLEAPGLDTFNLMQTRSSTLGMIDFVCDYLRTGQAPDATNYITESKGLEIDRGGLWVMPSGAQQDSYAHRFAGINWGELYDQHNGYLLFEDLKLQWEKGINPDYVLIDSRTGHTDIGGICTRQMPDAVIILFFPNAQNLRGLTKVVRDIRSETIEPQDKSINLHFVMSNVPDLDDEDDILAESLNSFRENLGFDDDPLMIHRYDSLSLLNQVIFTNDRPKSRLAREYRHLGEEIMRSNASDRDGALHYLESIDPMYRFRKTASIRRPSLASIDQHVKEIEANHRFDGKVLFRISAIKANDGSFEDSVALLNRAIETGYRKPEVYLRRADLRRRELDDQEGAIEDVSVALDLDDVSVIHVRQALALLPAERLHTIANSRAIANMSTEERTVIAHRLDRNEYEASLAVSIVSSLLQEPETPPHDRGFATDVLSLAFIATGRFSDAVQVILSSEPDLSKMKIEFAFNYGMALWGRDGRINTDVFEQVIYLAQEIPASNQTPNRFQCLALSHWATGNVLMARELAESARQAMIQDGGQEFSCWRYFRVSANAFNEDVDDLVKMIEGDDQIRPQFLSGSQPLNDSAN